MPPVFSVQGFKFAEGEDVPEHIEGFPYSGDRDRAKLWLEGLDTFAGEKYTLAIDIDDLPTAEALRVARLAHLEETQPTASSGGQSLHGIQDRVYIRFPQD